MSDFEQRLAESLRHGASQADVQSSRLRLPAEQLTVLPPVRRRPALAVAAAVLAVLALAVPTGWRHWDPGGTPLSIPAGTVGTPPPTEPEAPGPPWRLTAGLYHDNNGEHAVGSDEITLGSAGHAYLIVDVAPANPLGKTYLQQWRDGHWVQLGPHELNYRSRVTYLLWAHGGETLGTYRVFVPGTAAHAGAYSPVVTVRIQR